MADRHNVVMRRTSEIPDLDALRRAVDGVEPVNLDLGEPATCTTGIRRKLEGCQQEDRG